MSNLRKYLPVVLISGVLTGRLFANGFGILNQDAFATARGQAFVATADNPAAIYYNPAGIAQLEGDNLRGGAGGYYLNSTFTSPIDNNPINPNVTYHSAAYHYAAVPQGFYTHTFTNSSLTLGLGVYSPYGGNIDWPKDTGFDTIAVEGRLLYLTINPTAALKLAPHLFIGAGIMVNYVNLYTEQTIIQSPTANFFKFKGDGWSVGYNLGALYQPARWISLGGTFRSSAAVNLTGHSNYQEPPFIPPTTRPAEMPLTFPLTVVLGISLRPTPNWNVEFDANYTGWESFGTTSITQGGAPTLGVNQDITVNFNWRGSWIYEAGVTRYFGKDWHVSAGYAFDESSVPSQYYTPFAADMDRHFFSLGAGFTGKTIDFDITYQFGYGPGYTVYNSQPSSSASTSNQTADGKYTFRSSALLVSAGIHF